MSHESWREFFMTAARLYSTMSKDPEHKVGALLVDSERRIVCGGYNGFPRGVKDLPERYVDKFVKNTLIVHAEANAILNARGSIRDTTLYSTRYPCTKCTQMIIQMGIWKVVSPLIDPESSWADDAKFSASMLHEAGVLHEEYALPVLVDIKVGIPQNRDTLAGLKRIGDMLRPIECDCWVRRAPGSTSDDWTDRNGPIHHTSCLRYRQAIDGK